MIEVSIIICTYNRDKYLYTALQHVAENDFSTDFYEIILVNNNSTDTTETECERFQRDYPRCRFRYFVEYNQGLSYARNRGMEEAQGDFFVFLDDDSLVKSDYLTNLQAHLNKYSDLLAFGGKIEPLFETGEAPKWLSKWTYSWVSAIDLGAKTCLFKGNKYPIGANMGVSRKIVKAVGQFNTQLGRSKNNLMGGEEKDLFNRIKKLQGNIYYFPDIEVQHVIPESRTTKEYIKRMGHGIGMSEKSRTMAISKSTYLKRLFFEGVKWVGSWVFFLKYLLQFQPEKGGILLLFRWQVSKGLIEK
ncbi:MAG: glycosyltransferase [Bacteroidales bacterium]|jgi:glycosyltransferase involved in cell wall biosynthesis|nr:glycosyltransferase [Bacteroidales bacterium]